MRIRLLALALALGSGLAACDGSTGGDDGTFIALQSSFAGFRQWQSYYLGDNELAGHPPGKRYGYIKQKTTDSKYPVGAVILKTVESGTSEADWELFGMAKRGGSFNAGGAVGWEFFTMRIGSTGEPVIYSRGANPSDADADGGLTGTGYSDPAGSGTTCNRCHGVSGTDRTDHVLSPLLAPGAQP
jgi:hypothetical protein